MTAPASATASAPATHATALALGATGCLAALMVLSVAWETWLAPLRPGGSALMLKAVPLALMLPGVWRRRLYTLQWASMLILVYLAEGVVRGMSDGGLSARLGWVECALALGFFASALAYVAPFKRAAKRTLGNSPTAAPGTTRAAVSKPPSPARSPHPGGDASRANRAQRRRAPRS